MHNNYLAAHDTLHVDDNSAIISHPAQIASTSGNSLTANVRDNNLLIRIVTPLIALISQIRHTISHPNVATLRAQVIEEIKLVERRLSDARYTVRTIIATRYCLCTAIDEAILSQEWGTKSVWLAGGLLSLFQKETWGGERFYVILKDALRDISANIDFIEFIYFLMSLGFEGKYYGDEHRGVREDIRNRIFYHIRHARMKPERNLSRHAKDKLTLIRSSQRGVIIKRLVIVTSILLLSIAIFYNAKVYHAATPVITQLDKLATIDPNVIFGQVINRPLVLHNEEGAR